MNLKPFLYQLRQLITKNSKLKRFVKKVVPQKYITHLSYQKHTSEEFQSFFYNETLIYMSLSPLEDQRGIGRVTREQLKYLQTNLEPYAKQEYKKEIYFYSSIHWCPDVLKPNTFVMIHDVTPLVLKELFVEQEIHWNTKFKAIAQQAEHIITISENSKKDIHTFLDIDMQNISVVFNGVTPLQSKIEIDKLLPKNYFVYLGAFDYHKNLDIVFQALQSPLCKNQHLVLIGDNLESYKRAQELEILERVHFLGKLKDDDVGFVISNATALLFPSLYEGFGLPPMEASLLKTASICSSRPTMTEFLEDVVLFADPYDAEEWAKAMQTLEKDSKLREKLAKLAYDRVEKFTWESSCQKLLQVLSQ